MKKITHHLLLATVFLQCLNAQDSNGESTVRYSYVNQEDMIKKALAQNLDLKLDKIAAEIAEKRIEIEESRFGVVFEASYRYENIERPQNNREFISTGGGLDVRTEPRIFEEENHRADLNITKRFKQGQTLQFGTELRVLQNSLNEQVAPNGSSIFHPEYETFTGITLIQPLARGFGKEANTQLINAQISERDAANILYKVKGLATAAETSRRYNALYYANKIYDKKSEMLKEVLEQHEVYKDLFERKKITAADMLQSEAFLFQVQEDLNKEFNMVKERELLLHDISGSKDSSVKIVPTAPVYTDADRVLTKDEYLTLADKNRLDTLYFQKLLEASESNVNDAENRAKPVANLVLQGGLNGLAGNYDDSLNEALELQAPEFSVGIEYQASLTKSAEQIELEIAEKVVKSNKEKLFRSKAQARMEVITYWSKMSELISEKQLFLKRKKVLDETLEAQKELLKRGEGSTVELIEYQKQKFVSVTQELLLAEEMGNAFINLQLSSGSLFAK